MDCGTVGVDSGKVRWVEWNGLDRGGVWFGVQRGKVMWVG